MRGELHRGAAIAVSALVLAACSFVFDLPSTDIGLGGLGNGDAAADGPSSEAAATPSIVRRPPPAPFCANLSGSVVFCGDLDQPDASTVDLAPLGVAQIQQGQITIVDTVSFTPRRSLLMTADGAGARAALTRTIPAVTNGISISLDVLASKWQTTSAQVAQISLAGPNTQCDVRLLGVSGSWSVFQTCAGDAGPETVQSDSGHAIDSSNWHRFVLSVGLGTPKKVTLSVDGARAVDVGALDAFEAGSATLSFGPDRVTDGSIIAFLDDLAIIGP